MRRRPSLVVLVALAACGDLESPPPTQITFTGAGRGFIVTSEGVQCDASCSIDRDDTTLVTITAYPTSTSTPASAVSWSGCGEAVGGTCTRPGFDVEVAFEADEPEITTMLPSTDVTAIGIATDGYVLANASRIKKVNEAEEEIWSIERGADALRIGPDNDVYVRRSLGVARFGSQGETKWEVSFVASHMELMPGGDVAVATPSAIAVLSGLDGSVRWTKDVPGLLSIATDSTGTIVTGSAEAILKRFDRDGNPLPDWTLKHQGALQLAFDAQDQLHAEVTWPDVQPDPTSTFATIVDRALIKYDTTGGSSVIQSRVPANASGFAVGRARLAWEQRHGMLHVSPVETGAVLTATDTSDIPVWTIVKPAYGLIGGGMARQDLRLRVNGGACDRANRCAVFGTLLWRESSRPWVEVLRVP